MTSSHASLATKFRALHIPGKPIILTNIYDGVSARAVASLPQTTAFATASYAVANAAGLDDDDLTLEINLAAATAVSRVAKEFNLPLTVDFQDGYGERLEEGVGKLLDLGVVGVNIEDWVRGSGSGSGEESRLLEVDDAVDRIKRVLSVARERGVHDFVVNARTDVIMRGKGDVEEAVARGKRYLEAGATTVFVWGGSARGGITREEVRRLVEAFGGMLNVSLRIDKDQGYLTVKELTEIGVARMSLGPQLQFRVAKLIGEEAGKVLSAKD